ncbi:MAG: MFS transporter [Acidimicrobiales bacterium]
MRVSPEAPAETPPLPRRVLAGLLLALFTVSFNVQVMTVLMVPIARDLGTTLASVQNALVLTSLVAFAFVPTSRRLGSIYGYRRVFAVGLVIFSLGLLATAASPNALVLIPSYGILTGLGSSTLVTLPWMLVSRSATGLERDLGHFLLVMAIVGGSLVGPLIGGLVNSSSTWHWAFLLPLPLVLLVWYLVRAAGEVIENPGSRVDWAGATLSFAGMALLLLGTTFSSEYGWWQPLRTVRLGRFSIPPFTLSIVPLLLAAGAILLLIFTLRWHRSARRDDKIQMWQLGALRQVQFDIGLLTSMLFAVASAGLTYMLYMFLQGSSTFALTSFEAAITVLPYNLAVVLVLAATLLLGRRVAPKYVIQLGLLITILGLWILSRAFGPDATPTGLIPGLVVIGAGGGLVIGQVGPLTLSIAGEDRASEGRGLFNSVQDLSHAVGIAVFGYVLINAMSAAVVDSVLGAVDFPITDAQRIELIEEVERSAETMSGEELEQLWGQLADEEAEALVSLLGGPENKSMQQALGGVSVVLGMGFLVSLFLPKHRVV